MNEKETPKHMKLRTIIDQVRNTENGVILSNKQFMDLVRLLEQSESLLKKTWSELEWIRYNIIKLQPKIKDLHQKKLFKEFRKIVSDAFMVMQKMQSPSKFLYEEKSMTPESKRQLAVELIKDLALKEVVKERDQLKDKLALAETELEELRLSIRFWVRNTCR